MRAGRGCGKASPLRAVSVPKPAKARRLSQGTTSVVSCCRGRPCAPPVKLVVNRFGRWVASKLRATSRLWLRRKRSYAPHLARSVGSSLARCRRCLGGVVVVEAACAASPCDVLRIGGWNHRRGAGSVACVTSVSGSTDRWAGLAAAAGHGPLRRVRRAVLRGTHTVSAPEAESRTSTHPMTVCAQRCLRWTSTNTVVQVDDSSRMTTWITPITGRAGRDTLAIAAPRRGRRVTTCTCSLAQPGLAKR